jgi:hypothetical protein
MDYIRVKKNYHRSLATDVWFVLQLALFMAHFGVCLSLMENKGKRRGSLLHISIFKHSLPVIIVSFPSESACKFY